MHQPIENYDNDNDNDNNESSGHAIFLEKRVVELENAIKYVVTQEFDDICWLDVYQKLGQLIDINFEPKLLPKEKFLGNCAKFYECLQSGNTYECS